LAIDAGSTKGTLHFYFVGKPPFRIHLDETGFMDIMSAMKLGEEHLFKTNGARGDKKGKVMGHPVMMHNAHRVAIRTQRVDAGNNMEAFQTKRVRPQQGVKLGEHLDEGAKGFGNIKFHGGIRITMNHHILQGSLVGIIFQFDGNRLGPEIVRGIIARELVHFFWDSELGRQCLEKDGPFRNRGFGKVGKRR
jgi:hypothetical protein